MHIEQARQLAIALRNTMPTDPVRKAQWIHSMHCLRKILADEIPLLDLNKWECLCYPQND